MSTRLLVYGATGFTGGLVAAHAKHLRFPLTLAGRDARRVRAMAEPLGFPWLAFGLDGPARLDEALRPFDAVLNIAGPFAATARALAESCLRTRTHYLDLAGEPCVFEAMEGLDARARAAGVMLMPGVGLIVLATDCLAAHVAGRLPGARRLRLGMAHTRAVSRGSLKTTIDQFGVAGGAVAVRRDGRLVSAPPGRLEHWFDYGEGLRVSAALGWPDLITAHHSTGIPDIEVYLEVGALARHCFALGGLLAAPMRSPPWRALMEAQARLWPEGPSQAWRDDNPRIFVAEAEDRWRRKAISRLRAPNGYDFTPVCALAVAEEVLAGHFSPGFQTPAKLYGADFVMRFPGVYREDFDGHGRALPPA